MKKRSKREDGRGHWPAGRHRNPDTGNWSEIRLQLQALLDNHYSIAKRIYVLACAEDIGVSERSVRRWLAGSHRPEPESQKKIASWIKLARKRAKK